MEISCRCLNLISLGEIIRVGHATKFGVIDYCNFSEVKEIVIDAD